MKDNVTKITMVYPSAFEDDYGVIEPRLSTIHTLDPTYDDKGYVKTYGKRLKIVSRHIITNKILSIKPY
jgi:hypothetical protein